MIHKEHLAELLVIATSIYSDREFLSLSKAQQDHSIRRLHNYGVLSTPAMAAITGVSNYRVRQAIKGLPHPTSRGRLNPEHLSRLGYMLSWGTATPTSWFRIVVNGGTNVSTIADLTGLSEATIYRRLDE